MSESRLDARIVRLDYHQGNAGLWYATSPDCKGLVIGRPSIKELEEAVPQAIVDMWAACGVRVIVTKVSPQDNLGEAWVAVPQEAACRPLDARSSSSA
jgi:hypothetical protein